ncbi:cytochrome P450 [Podospora appendiculata]|uniref:Cytochrome P450 n=1 Tax=Podospora appendiculata TaxID=314037 RepID=A0AAE0XAF9_9PEZI|nr:cytochrome P450 [Podospora appendiculata]
MAQYVLEFALFIVLLLAVTLFMPSLTNYLSLRRLPLNGAQHGSYPNRLMAFTSNAEQLYREGYAKFKHTVYRVTTVEGSRVVIPTKYLEELRHLPDSTINNIKSLFQIFEGKYTGLNENAPLINHVVRTDLTRALARLSPRLCEEVDRCIKAELPPCDDWTPVVISPIILRIVAILSGNLFLGPELCRSDEYLHMSINYTVDLFAAVAALKRYPKILRPLAQYFTPELSSIQDHKRRANAFLLPVIRRRRAMTREGMAMPDDMLQWMINKADSFNVKDDAELAYCQLSLSLAAIHTTSITATHIIYDLAAHPAILHDLRHEIHSVLQATNGAMSSQALFQMKLLDSVMRESQRLNPTNMARFTRYVAKPVTLQDGTGLPAGYFIESPHMAICRDPLIYPEPDTFNPHRFLHLRQLSHTHTTPPTAAAAAEHKHQFVSATPDNLSFGYGRHACPGRFFASHELKLILAHLILAYDIRLPADANGVRYRNVVRSAVVVPDVGKAVLLRRVVYE